MEKIRVKNTIADAVFALLYAALSCCGLLIVNRYWLLVFIVPAALFINVAAGISYSKIPTLRLQFCRHGTGCLTVFYFTLIAGLIYHAYLCFLYLPDNRVPFTVSAAVFAVCEFLIFWNGIISVYCTSIQLGIRTRVLGIIFGLIPPANLIMLWIIIKKCRDEVEFEPQKSLQNLSALPTLQPHRSAYSSDAACIHRKVSSAHQRLYR